MISATMNTALLRTVKLSPSAGHSLLYWVPLANVKLWRGKGQVKHPRYQMEVKGHQWMGTSCIQRSSLTV